MEARVKPPPHCFTLSTAYDWNNGKRNNAMEQNLSAVNRICDHRREKLYSSSLPTVLEIM